MRRIPAAAVLGVVVTAVTVGCAVRVPSPAPPASVASSTPSIEPSEAMPPTAGTVIVDPTLLEVLPVTVDGVERREDAESAAEIAATIGVDVEALAVALYADVDDYAVATVVRPRPGVVSEAWFRDWRDGFDDGVCEQAGGVDPGRSEFEVDGRTVHRSTCAGGVVIHHVRLADPDRIVSIQGAGPSDLGRAIVDDLTE